ncbi:hypothetical protein RHSIM_Rhsim06G0088700 [Rhododendron simsii]|uniref:Uncharacterized protein n=1 Tax=Rhododendron simsii TaxID=118357 RepID=A0A834GUR5_RHOSS|nr:hypothetical protein RHSIM_Rhsim06G0088700 [Rhododendron simsii]
MLNESQSCLWTFLKRGEMSEIALPGLMRITDMRSRRRVREQSLRGPWEHRHREEVYERRPARATDPPAVVLPKAPQTKVKMVLEQLVSSPFTDAVKNARSLKNFTAPKFNQYDPKIGDTDFYLHPSKDMDDLMLRINQHCQMSEDMAERWKVIGGFDKIEPGKGGKAVHNIQKGKGNDRWGEQGDGGYQREYVRGLKPHEFAAEPAVFKDSLHELLKKVEHEPYFSYPVDDVPCQN